MAKYDPSTYHRRSIRLKGYDYRQAGAYFVTICAQQRAASGIDWFGTVAHGAMHLNAAGLMVQTIWGELPSYYSGVAIDAYIIMPDHLHGVIVLTGAGMFSLPDVVQRFKSLTTTRYRHGVAHEGWLPLFPGRLWQRNYYERVIRGADELERVRAYIAANPARWAL